jgi:hypothetical protein
VIPHILYLDVDGVVLVRDSSRHGFRVADYAEEFLTWAVESFDVRWLSTRCQGGNVEEVRRAFRLAGLAATSPTWASIERIPAIKWGTSKTQAIDIAAECWWWVDDNPTQDDLDLLRRSGRLDRLIKIAATDPQALQRAQTILQAACGLRATSVDLPYSGRPK